MGVVKWSYSRANFRSLRLAQSHSLLTYKAQALSPSARLRGSGCLVFLIPLDSAAGVLFGPKLRIDGKIYLAYSGEVARDSSQARLLKRAWESLRRDSEFREDYQRVTTPGASDRIKQWYVQKWGVGLIDPARPFNEVVDEAATVKLDDPDTFDDMYRRLYGDTFYGEDRVVQCDELLALYHLRGAENFRRLAAIARGQVSTTAPLVTLQDGSSVPHKINLTIDIDENLIATLYKVQFILRALREARVQAGKAEEIPKRVKQQLETLEEMLDDDLIGDRKRNFQQDDEVFQVWDLVTKGKSDSEIAQCMWLEEYRRVGGRDTATGEKGPLIQRVHRYKARAEKWIHRYSEVVKNKGVAL